MTVEKITRLRQRGWENMMRIALRYPKNCKRRVFAKWDNRNQRLGKKLKRILDSQNRPSGGTGHAELRFL